jgi:hypothetical protein
VYVALCIAFALLWGVCWALWRSFIAFGDYLSVEATEERKRSADLLRAQIAEDEAAIDWGAQAWAKIKVAPLQDADPCYHGDILNAARAAILRGEKPCPAVDRLVAMGVNPSVICREHNVILPHERAARRAAWPKIGLLFVFGVFVVFVAGKFPAAGAVGALLAVLVAAAAASVRFSRGLKVASRRPIRAPACPQPNG